MAKTAISIEQIDLIIEKAPKAVKATGTKKTKEAEAQSKLCQIYSNGGKEILSFAKLMLAFRPKWQEIITGLIAGLDASCKIK
jgi:hypothetical protein